MILRFLLAASAALPLLFSVPARGAAEAPAPARKVVTRLDELPRHTYTLQLAPSVMVSDAQAMAHLAEAVRADIEADLAAHDIRDRTTLQRYKGTQLTLALLRRDSAVARALIAELRALEEKPALRLTTGLVAEAWLHALEASEPRRSERLAEALQSAVSALPWEVVGNEIKEAKGSYEIRSAALIVGQLRESVDPAALKTGAISQDIAWRLLSAHHQLANILPLKGAIVSVYARAVAAHTVQKPDLWSPRQVALEASERAQPVVLGIWDSGVDTAGFPESLLHRGEDGRRGIAFDLFSRPVPELLCPLGEAEARLPAILAQLKGFLDLRAAVDSAEASALKQSMAVLSPEQVRPFIEDLSLVSNYAHGTHVAGIAAEGNPFARLAVARITFDHRMIPERPTVELARAGAAAYQATVDYLRRQGARVVNMSWGGSLRDVEAALEANGAGGDASERAKLAREIFDIDRDGLLAALRQAPEILFVVAAGNSDNDVKFDEFIPSSFQLPNMITVGAVDRAGDETSFSSFGPMVAVHANGFEVDGPVPGGRRMKFSGTSMAAPQVANLAAKLFALDPALTVAEAKDLIVSTAESRGRVNLVHPAAAVRKLRERLANSAH